MNPTTLTAWRTTAPAPDHSVEHTTLAPVADTGCNISAVGGQSDRQGTALRAVAIAAAAAAVPDLKCHVAGNVSRESI